MKGKRAFAAFRISFGSAGAAIAVLVAATLTVLAADFISPHDPLQTFEGAYRLPGFWSSEAHYDPRFVLGTDDVGRDVLSRLLHGARWSMLAGLAVAVLATALGVILGSFAAWWGRSVDALISRAMDVLMALPSILLAIVVVTILGPSLLNAILAATLTAIPGITRVVRAQLMLEMSKPYVAAARIAGAGGFRIVLRELLPNCGGPILVQATLGFGDGLLNVAALGFLGLGARPPAPEWGAMLADARGFVESDPALVTLPGLCIFLVIWAFNILGDEVRDHCDPKTHLREAR